VKLAASDVQRLAAAKALEWAQAKGGTVSSVNVEGQSVSLADAKQTLDQVLSQPREALPSTTFDRLVDRFDTKVKKLEDKLGGTEVGKKAIAVIQADPERVAKKLQVEVKLQDGRSEKLTVEVIDVQLTALLNRLTATSEVLSITPFIGEGFTALAAIASTAGAKIAQWEGKPELAEALQKTALKQWVLLGVGFVPGIGTATGIMAAARDWKDKQNILNGPAVSVIAEPA
jgi:hypothetical protein